MTSGETPKPKRGKQGKDDEDEGMEGDSKKGEDDLVPMMKLLLQTAQGHRALASTVQHTWLLPPSLGITKIAKEVAKEYQTKVEAQGKGHHLGPPHVHIFMAVLTHILEEPLMTLGTDAKEMTTENKALAPYTQYFEKKGQKELEKAITFFKVKDTFAKTEEEKLSKVHLQAHPLFIFDQKGDIASCFDMTIGHFMQALDDLLTKMGGERKLGQAPRGALERVVENSLHRHQGSRK